MSHGQVDAEVISGNNPAAGAPAASARRRPLALALLIALRPKQWSKNLLLFAGLLFTLDRNHGVDDFAKAVAGFLVFCLLSGCVYVLNDLQDIAVDRLHPKKRFRPIACGDLPSPIAWAFFALMTPSLLVLAWCISRDFFAAAAIYFAVTVAYTFRLKHVVILDVLALASGFVLRAVAGALAIGVAISVWLMLCTLLLALFLGLTKRRSELAAIGDGVVTRQILNEYSLPLLDQMTTIVAAACLMAYSLYTFNSETAGRTHHYLMATIPFVLYGLFRYLYLSHIKGAGENPETVLLEDRPMQVNLLLYVLAVAAIVVLTRFPLLRP